MINYNVHEANYSVSGLQGFSFPEALRCWKTRYRTIEEFYREVITHPGLAELGACVTQEWARIEPLKVQEAFLEDNMERRRVFFECIGPSRLFPALSPKLIDRQVLRKVQTRWDRYNRPYIHVFEDVYELYEIAGEKLFQSFMSNDGWRTPEFVYTVRCWCATTQREYWIYIPRYAALGSEYARDNTEPDAIRAIAWTIQLTISHPKRILRQGDIIIVEESEASEEVPVYYLSKEQYINLLYSET